MVSGCRQDTTLGRYCAHLDRSSATTTVDADVDPARVNVERLQGQAREHQELTVGANTAQARNVGVIALDGQTVTVNVRAAGAASGLAQPV